MIATGLATSELADKSRNKLPGGLRILDLLEAKLPWLFLIYALPGVIFLSITMAPFQVADERAHMMRADQVARGTMVSSRFGGAIDRGLVTLGALYETMWFHPEIKQTAELARQAGAVRWQGAQGHVDFQNTAQYGPFLYLPQAAAIGLGRLAGLRVAQTLVLTRLLNALSACGLGFFALMICRRGRALTFAVLLLPMTLSELASASQDALLISLSIFVVALASRILTERRHASASEFAVFAFAVMATTLARPSQIALALLAPAFVRWRDPQWRTKLPIAAVAAVLVLIWMRLLVRLVPPVPSDQSAALQASHLIAHPFALVAVMANTFIANHEWLWRTVIGHLGWTDAPMPAWYYMAATIAFVFAVIAPGNRGPILRPALLAIVTLAGLITATCLVLYLSWTPVDSPRINGLQGRYILPVLPLVGWLAPAYRPRLEQTLARAWYPVLIFPVVTLAALPSVIMERYYGSWPLMAECLRLLLLS
jgi:hypothetical protein